MSKGGRGGRVIKVTNLNPSGPGSLLEACMAEGPRIVVFDVSGVIRGDVYITNSNITIAGQSAPQPGITIEGRLVARSLEKERLKDIQVRFLRIRQRPVLGVGGDVIQFPKSEKIIIDHVSLAWGNDEMIDIIHSSDVTIQWSTLEESELEGHAKGERHNFGILSAYPDSGNISIHHNLFAHHSRRLPSLSPGEKNKPGDFRNNIVYNFETALHHDGHIPQSGINIIGNYYKRGPSSDTVVWSKLDERASYYFRGNYIEGFGYLDDLNLGTAKIPRWVKILGSGILLHQEVSVAPVATQSAEHTYVNVLRFAGMYPRDQITLRTINEVKTGTGAWGRMNQKELSDKWYMLGMPTELPGVDSDNDGIPDYWEQAQNMNHLDGTDMNQLMKSGYTAIEEYLNYRANQLLTGFSD